MKCPVCKEPDLTMSDRQGIEIDYCPRCRGVWLDRGELDKIIERSAGEGATDLRPPPRSRDDSDRYAAEHRRYDDDDDDRYKDGQYRRKRKGFLGDIFDFD